MKGKPSKGSYAWVFLLAVAVRVLAIVLLGSWSPEPANNYWAAGWETGQIADHLARADGFALETGIGWDRLGPTAWLAPLYPSIVGAVFRLLGSFTGASMLLVLVFQALCDGVTCVALGRLGARLGRARAGIVAATLFALSPAAINISTRVVWCTPLLTCLCVILVARMLEHARAESTWKQSVLTGLLIAACLLTSPSPALFVGAAAVWVGLRRGAAGWRAVATMALVSLAVISPWVVRNERALGGYFFIKSNAGNELFIGNNPLADGSYIRSRDTAREVLPARDFEQLSGLNELERSRALGAHSRAWIAGNPGRFLGLTGTRVWRYWSAPLLTDWERLPLGSLAPVAASVYSLGRWLVLLAAGVGCVLLIRGHRDSIVVLLFLAAYPVAYYVTHVSISRYRTPVLPLLFLVAALGIDSLWQTWRRRAAGQEELSDAR